MEYKLLLFVALAFIFCSCNSSSDEESAVELEQNESSEGMQDQLTFSNDLNSTEAIRAEYEKTMQVVNSGAMDSTSLSYDCYGETSGTVTYYQKDGTLRMIENSYNKLSHRDVSERYFVSNGTPYFVYRKTTDWSFIASQETRDKVKEERFYVLDDTLAQCLTKEYVLKSNATDNPNPGQAQSEAAQCLPIGELMDQYNRLLSHKEETGKIECLE